MRWEGRGFPIDGAGGRAGGVSCELILANLVCGQRGGPRLAAEERSEMPHPSPRGANGPELAHRVVFEIGVEEVPERRPVRRELPRRRLRRPGHGPIGRGGQRVVWCHRHSLPVVRLHGCRALHIRSGGRHSKGDCAGVTGTRGDRWLTKPRTKRVLDDAQRGGGSRHRSGTPGPVVRLSQCPPPPTCPPGVHGVSTPVDGKNPQNQAIS